MSSQKELQIGMQSFSQDSILKAFNELSFRNFWYETGSPTFLINLLKEKKYFLPNQEKIEVGLDSFSTYDI